MDLRAAIFLDTVQPFPPGRTRNLVPTPTYQPRSRVRLLVKRKYSVDNWRPPFYQFLSYGQMLGSVVNAFIPKKSRPALKEVIYLRAVAMTFRGIRRGGLQVEAMENIPIIPSLLGEETNQVEKGPRPYTLVHLVAYLATREPIDVDAIHRWDSVDRPQLVDALREYSSLSDIDAIHRIEMLMGPSSKPPVLTGNL